MTEDKRSSSSLLFATTPALRAVFDERMPGHDYETSFPAALLLDPVMADVPVLSRLLRGTSVVHPIPLREENEEQKRRMAALEADLSESSYQSLVSPRETLSASGLTIASVLPSTTDRDDRKQARLMRNQMSTIVNIAISMVTAAMAAWYWTPAQVGLPQRVLVCFASAIALGAAEVFLYVRYLVKIEQARDYDATITKQEKEKKKKN